MPSSRQQKQSKNDTIHDCGRNEVDVDMEISRDESIRILLTDSDIADIQLRGSDGVLVPANKGILASRSTVFRRMFFGNFSEASKLVADVGYPGHVIQALIEYIYSDDAPIFHQNDEDDSLPSTIVALVDAANYYALSGLRHKAAEFARTWMERDPLVALTFLSACDQSSISTVVEEYCYHVIRSHATDILNGGGKFSLLNVSQMKKVLRDDKIEADELALFKMIQLWVKDGNDEEHNNDADNKEDDEEEDDASNDSNDEDSNISMNEDDDDFDTVASSKILDEDSSHSSTNRTSFTSELIKQIRLDKIDPLDLKNTVKSSGLVSLKRLFSVYESQAIATSKLGNTYNKPRSCSHHWNVSGDVFTSTNSKFEHGIIRCRKMKRGIYKWTIRVIELGDCEVWLGVHEQRSYWLYSNSGSTFRKGTVVKRGASSDSNRLPTFSKGSIVSFKLELGPGQGCREILSVSVNNGSFYRLFSNMLTAGDTDTGEETSGGFVPAALLMESGSVQFLRFETV